MAISDNPVGESPPIMQEAWVRFFYRSNIIRNKDKNLNPECADIPASKLEFKRI